MINFKIIVTAYKAKEWISKNIQSIRKQNYNNFACIIIDDNSSDETPKIIKKEINGDDRFSFVCNDERKLALSNVCNGIKTISSDNEDVIAIVDGDDWLAHNDVLAKLNEIYCKKQCWLTYGNFVYSSGVSSSHNLPYNNDVIKNGTFRDFSCQASHLKTFKYGLRAKIKTQDLLFDEKFIEKAWDLAVK